MSHNGSDDGSAVGLLHAHVDGQDHAAVGAGHAELERALVAHLHRGQRDVVLERVLVLLRVEHDPARLLGEGRVVARAPLEVDGDLVVRGPRGLDGAAVGEADRVGDRDAATDEVLGVDRDEVVGQGSCGAHRDSSPVGSANGEGSC